MPFKLIWLADVLRGAGLTVVEQPGWKTRGRGDMGTVRGVLCHHTAAAKRARGNAPSLTIVQNGRPDLQGPLAQIVLGRDGTFYVVAAGRCNHAGAGNWRGITAGNSSFIGIEAENSGLADDNPWPEAQMDAYARGVAALLSHMGADTKWCVGHLEYALPVGRKSDPSFSVGNREQRIKGMDAFRARVASHMRPAPAPVARLLEDIPDGPGDVVAAEEAGGDQPVVIVPSVTEKVEKTSAEEVASSLSADEINAVVERLRKLKYHEVGLANGEWGGRLCAAIAAFKNDRHLSGEPVIDEALLAELRAAENEGWSRPIAKERAEGMPEGSRVIDASQKQGWFGGSITLTGFVALFSEYIEPVKPYIKPVTDFAASNWKLILIAGGAFIVWQAGRAFFARRQDHREGKTT